MEAAGDPGPWRQQAILGRGDWDADDLRDIVRDYVIEHLADDDAVLVIDETGFLKQGKASCGVARQYTGSAGKITNCQIGVFATYVSRHGHAFIDRALYLPKEWTDDPDRLEAAYVPDDVGFATKPKLARAMIARAIAASVPFQWVAGDTVYGIGDIEQQLRQAGKGYVLGVSSAHVFRSWGKRSAVAGTAGEIARTRHSSDWKRLSAGAGTKGPRLHDWCYLELADLEAEQLDSANGGLWTRGLLIRRHIADGDLAFFTTWCPAGTSIETLVAIEGHRWAIEDSFETAKNELGLDHNESRSWHGWHRHVSLVMLAFAMMAAIRHRANPPAPKKPTADIRQKPGHDHAVADPLVNPGNPPHRHKTGSKAHSPHPYHRMVALAKGPSGDRSTRSLQCKTATVMLGPHRTMATPPFSRFPTWMWRNTDVESFVRWLREHNAARSAQRRVGFYGLDLYNMRASMAAVLEYLGKVDPGAAAEARERYACLAPWSTEPAAYGRASLSEGYAICERPVLSILVGLARNAIDYAAHDGERFFDATQNARLVADAERYYRVMYYGAHESWNLRDQHMFDTLERILAVRGPASKAVVWAHNSHIGDARYTEMGAARGELNIGQLCRERFDRGAALIGFGTHSGTVMAASDWDAPAEVKTVRPSHPDSYESLCHDTDINSFLVDLRPGRNEPLRDALREPRLERYIGVIYRPDTERMSHYSQASLPEQYDGFVWFDETRAVTPLSTQIQVGEDETYPFGL